MSVASRLGVPTALVLVLAVLVRTLVGGEAAPRALPEDPGAPTPAAELDDVSGRVALRGPVALAELAGRRLLCAGNRRTGTVTMIDGRTLEVVAEYAVARRLADIAAVSGSDDLLVLDEAAARLILLDWRQEKPVVAGRLPVARSPVSLSVYAGGERCVVASLWGRALTAVDLPGPGSDALRTVWTVALPFSPRAQVLVERHAKLLVADAFGENFALVDTALPRLASVRRLPGHNTRGLALSADGSRLFVSHPVLNPLAPTNTNDIHWGMVIANLLRSVPLRAALDPDGDLLAGAWYSQFGDGDNAAGDPGDVAVDRAGRVAVALGGVAEIALASGPELAFRRVAVGCGPAAVLFSAAGDRIYVANRFDDTVSVIDPDGLTETRTITLGPQPDLTAVDRGERLFHDASLALDGWYSCHTCHTDGHTNGLRNDNLGDGSFGAPKRVPSLLGTGDSGPWAWNGETSTLEEQVERSARTTMRGRPLTGGEAGDLAAFLRALPPPAPAAAAPAGAARELAGRGHEVFTNRGCDRCHAGPAFTSARDWDVGLTDEAGNRRFNPPSLRGIGWREAFFHDGRERELDGVFTRHAHGLDTGALASADLAALLAFLRTL